MINKIKENLHVVCLVGGMVSIIAAAVLCALQLHSYFCLHNYLLH